MVRDVVDEELKGRKSLERKYIGENLKGIKKDMDERIGMEKNYGEMIKEVVKDGKEENEGMKVGEVVM